PRAGSGATGGSPRGGGGAEGNREVPPRKRPLEEGGPWGKHGFLHGSEPKASDAHRSGYPTESAGAALRPLGEHDLRAARPCDRVPVAVCDLGRAEHETFRAVNDPTLGPEPAGPRRAVEPDAQVSRGQV